MGSSAVSAWLEQGLPIRRHPARKGALALAARTTSRIIPRRPDAANEPPSQAMSQLSLEPGRRSLRSEARMRPRPLLAVVVDPIQESGSTVALRSRRSNSRAISRRSRRSRWSNMAGSECSAPTLRCRMGEHSFQDSGDGEYICMLCNQNQADLQFVGSESNATVYTPSLQSFHNGQDAQSMACTARSIASSEFARAYAAAGWDCDQRTITGHDDRLPVIDEERESVVEVASTPASMSSEQREKESWELLRGSTGLELPEW